MTWNPILSLRTLCDKITMIHLLYQCFYKSYHVLTKLLIEAKCGQCKKWLWKIIQGYVIQSGILHVQCTLRVQSQGMGTIVPITLIERTLFRINLISINVRINQASFWSVVFLTTILLRTLNSNKVTKMRPKTKSATSTWCIVDSWLILTF